MVFVVGQLPGFPVRAGASIPVKINYLATGSTDSDVARNVKRNNLLPMGERVGYLYGSSDPRPRIVML
jgi:hypothetical protein